MGGAQSAPTRKISIPNEDSHFIKVSESVAERLRKCTEGTPEQYMDMKAPGECPPSELESNVRNDENIPKHLRKYSGDAWINYYYGPSVTSLRILQAKEKELKESEEYWNRRIQNMENHHSKLSKIMEDEYAKAVNEISCQIPRPPPGTPFPCGDERQKLLKCYQKNPDQILLCAGEVNQFSECVHAKRIQAERSPQCEETK